MAASDDISTGLNQISGLIKLLTASPSPTITINGETIDTAGYLSNLKDTLPVLLQVQQSLQGPFQRATRMRT
ncbi:hypothetical protein UFOVP731_7 [uncultured Caudovirales phage]|uniref:Uncharacterized protein n=1 Tax=uncultured Caudovirales phage TaxID=2100421 RepID=A0A6J5NNX6_9CAUD|nr:hypothetical protein UFOVP731_7 [uncultured Caudovirales phage]